VSTPDQLQQLWDDLQHRWPESTLEPSLARISSLVDLLGEPQRGFRVIHVTGTNGKTSTSRMIDSLLRSQGLRTGLFTSPHLLDPQERICIDGEPISPEMVLRTWEDIRPYVEVVDTQSIADGGPAMSFFEVMTGIAFAAFADAPVDVAVIEVGMGGEWDATNVVVGDVAVITPIDRDHMAYLGDEPRDIAVEKSGIVKNDAVAVIAEQRPEVLDVLRERCEQVHAPLLLEGENFACLDSTLAVGGQQVTIQVGDTVYTDLFVPLHGAHQGRNAATAMAAVTAFLGGRALDAAGVEEAFGAVRSPGRMQIVRRHPTVMVDTAHNPHGLRAAMDTMTEAFDFAHRVVIFGVLADKDVVSMLQVLGESGADVVLCTPRSPRALPEADLTAIATDVLGPEQVWIARDMADAIDRAITLVETADDYGNGGVLVTGSIVLVADAMRTLGVTT
jgi:dihydrofolate synthase / folylpolyglutamate synthase